MIKHQPKPDIWDFSLRLRMLIMTKQHIVYGWKCVPECGNWKVLVIKNRDVYRKPNHQEVRDDDR